MNADGSDQRQLTSNSKDEVLPSWSPDGREIAFANRVIGMLFVVSADGSGPRHETVRRAEPAGRKR